MKDYYSTQKIKISIGKRKNLKVSLPTYSFQKKEKGAKNVN